MTNKTDFRLLVISDRKSVKNNSIVKTAEKCFAAGIKVFQLREKDLPSSELLNLALKIGKSAQKHGSKLIINDRVDIAMLSGANGIHSPENGTKPKDVRRFTKKLIIGKSTHSLESAVKAEKDGYDYIIFGPVFRTKSKIKYGRPRALKELKEVCSKVGIPVFAVGGINPSRAAKCIEAGAKGVAVIGSVMKSGNIKKTVLEFKKSLGRL